MKISTLAAALATTTLLGFAGTALLADQPATPMPAVSDDHADWQSLIGQGLDGWTLDKPNLASHWENKDGVIVGKNPDKKGSILWTDANDFGDFEMIVEYRTPSKDYDSGVFVRAESHQIQIGVSRSLKKDMTGSIYAPSEPGENYPAKTDTDAIAEKHDLGGWNTLRIVCKDKQVTTYLNDAQIIDYASEKIPASGKIGLQLHGNVNMEMHFRVVKVRQLGE